MREVLYIANSEGLKCEEYKLMKNERYLSDVPGEIVNSHTIGFQTIRNF